MDETALWVWFATAFGAGTPRAHRALGRFVHPRNLLEKIKRGITPTIFTPKEWELLNGGNLTAAHRVVERAAELGAWILTPDSPEYPSQLLNIYSPPLTLYGKGTLSGLEGRLAIGMVGAREMTDYGCRVALGLAQELAGAGVVIVSGLAAGVDSISHTGAIKAEGTTIGVLGCGIDVIYPRENRELYTAVAAHGAVITEFPPGTSPYGGNFPVRNRIISGLSQGVVVVEAGERSGSLLTAGHALEQGREVFAVPGPIDSRFSKGCNRLIQDGAKSVIQAEDILEEYRSTYHLPPPAPKPLPPPRQKGGGSPKPKGGSPKDASPGETPPTPPPKEPPAHLSPVQRVILGELTHQPRTADSIAEVLELPIPQVLAALTQLELEGCAKARGGRNFSL